VETWSRAVFLPAQKSGAHWLCPDGPNLQGSPFLIPVYKGESFHC